MIKGMTKSGFEFEVNENVMDNMELVDALTELEDSGATNSMAMSRVAAMVLGKEQRKRLYDHHREEDGRVPVAAVYEDIGEIFTAFGQQAKNS